ncbi:hypothetical protein BO78DRAFT_210031 [Aspergillus sclerotiicarbonarius CBS 121057]|uniref:Uncharacterized protein n=1 Tax=Aspergillus sclerotiicarbonarius (strain CBS 121057 / IBT 28362) TaxID=1448318 RepID=A0A319DYK5_ASPSB|nr:hypothetical protein BO78DRAFT_210031 [Aspergillus sclerotiicarbonarius CBS 121057]
MYLGAIWDWMDKRRDACGKRDTGGTRSCRYVPYRREGTLGMEAEKDKETERKKQRGDRVFEEEKQTLGRIRGQNKVLRWMFLAWVEDAVGIGAVKYRCGRKATYFFFFSFSFFCSFLFYPWMAASRFYVSNAAIWVIDGATQ